MFGQSAKKNEPQHRGFMFFIDDLDRINPESAVQILELLKKAEGPKLEIACYSKKGWSGNICYLAKNEYACWISDWDVMLPYHRTAGSWRDSVLSLRTFFPPPDKTSSLFLSL